MNSAVMGKRQGVHSSAFLRFKSSPAASFSPLARIYIIFMRVHVEKKMATGISTLLHSVYVCVYVCISVFVCVLVIPPMAD